MAGTGTIKLPPFLHFSTSARDWPTEVILLAKGNTATVCLFTEPDPALRERFDGTAECTQEGHSLHGKIPDAETTISFNRLRKEYRNGQMLFTSAIRLSLDGSTKQAPERESSSETDFNALLKWVDKSYGRISGSVDQWWEVLPRRSRGQTQATRGVSDPPQGQLACLVFLPVC
jgi:hypothetical protein